MATDQRRHFADPLHLLLKTRYNRTATHVCDICQAELAGMVGYRCNACDVDIHEACADYFKETISFFAHPWHALTLSRMPDDCIGWSCDLCREECPRGSFVYRCIQCNFDVHPLCTMLPQTIGSPLHPEHYLNMVPSRGSCSACGEDLPMWHYRCGFCRYTLHIRCISGAPSDSGQGAQATGSGARSIQTTAVRPRRRTRVAKFLLETIVNQAITQATFGLAEPVIEVLKEAMGMD